MENNQQSFNSREQENNFILNPICDKNGTTYNDDLLLSASSNFSPECSDSNQYENLSLEYFTEDMYVVIDNLLKNKKYEDAYEQISDKTFGLEIEKNLMSFICSKHGNLTMIKTLLSEKNIDIHIDDDIMFKNIIKCGWLKCLKFFIEEKGFSIDFENGSALKYSIIKNYKKCFNYIISKHPKYNKEYLSECIKNNRPYMIIKLLKYDKKYIDDDAFDKLFDIHNIDLMRCISDFIELKTVRFDDMYEYNFYLFVIRKGLFVDIYKTIINISNIINIKQRNKLFNELYNNKKLHIGYLTEYEFSNLICVVPKGLCKMIVNLYENMHQDLYIQLFKSSIKKYTINILIKTIKYEELTKIFNEYIKSFFIEKNGFILKQYLSQTNRYIIKIMIHKGAFLEKSTIKLLIEKVFRKVDDVYYYNIACEILSYLINNYQISFDDNDIITMCCESSLLTTTYNHKFGNETIKKNTKAIVDKFTDVINNGNHYYGKYQLKFLLESDVLDINSLDDFKILNCFIDDKDYFWSLVGGYGPIVSKCFDLKCNNNELLRTCFLKNKIMLFKELLYNGLNINVIKKEDIIGSLQEERSTILFLYLQSYKHINKEIKEELFVKLLEYICDYSQESDYIKSVMLLYDNGTQPEINDKLLKNMSNKKSLQRIVNHYKIKEMPLLPVDIQDIIRDISNNKENLLLEKLNVEKGVIAIISCLKNQEYYVHCYEPIELKEIFENQQKIYKWDKGPVLSEPVYKLPHNGIFINKQSMKYLNTFNTFMIMLCEEKCQLGSSFGVSQIHGDIYDMYMLKPINFSKLLKIKNEPITVNDIFNFKPTKEDLLHDVFKFII